MIENVQLLFFSPSVSIFCWPPSIKSAVAIIIFSMFVDLIVFPNSTVKYNFPFKPYFRYLLSCSGCLPLKKISNGTVQRYETKDDTVIYRFFLNGSSAISCFRGQRNGSTPSCLQGKEIFIWYDKAIYCIHYLLHFKDHGWSLKSYWLSAVPSIPKSHYFLKCIPSPTKNQVTLKTK